MVPTGGCIHPDLHCSFLIPDHYTLADILVSTVYERCGLWNQLTDFPPSGPIWNADTDSMVLSDLPGSNMALYGRPTKGSESNNEFDMSQSSQSNPSTNEGDPNITARIFQCPVGSHVLRDVVKLPCGHCLCKMCLPNSYIRVGIENTWPGLPGRLEGIRCPCCQQEHSRGDCWPDYLSNTAIRKVQSLIKTIGATALEDAQQLGAAFKEIHLDITETDIDTNLSFAEDNGDNNLGAIHKVGLLLRQEMDCAICHCLLYNPWTTPCGHTFCQHCITRSLGISPLCPTCRTHLSLQYLKTRINPPNKFIVRVTTYFWSEDLARRKEVMDIESSPYPPDVTGLNTPLFVCTVSFPRMPTFLHVFEPKYREMMTRVWDDGRGGKYFGMVLPDQHNGISPIGVHLLIDDYTILPDDRGIVVESLGTSRFRVKRWSLHSGGYVIAEVEDLEDVSLYEEENREAEEMLNAPTRPADFKPTTYDDLTYMFTKDLMKFAFDTIQLISGTAPAWLNLRIIALYGPCPSDPILFPWWLGSIIPVSLNEKARLLAQTTVRERMKICCWWLIQWSPMKKSW